MVNDDRWIQSSAFDVHNNMCPTFLVMMRLGWIRAATEPFDRGMHQEPHMPVTPFSTSSRFLTVRSIRMKTAPRELYLYCCDPIFMLE